MKKISFKFIKSIKKKWFWIGGGILLVVIVGGVFLASRVSATQAGPGVVSQQTYAIKKTTLYNEISATGNVRAIQSATLAWQTSGQVKTVNVKLNDTVKADQVLAELDQSTVPASVTQAQLDLIDAKQALEDLETSTTSVAQAQVALVTAQTAYDEAEKDVAALSLNRATETTLTKAETAYQLALAEVAKAQDDYDNYKNLDDTDYRKITSLNRLTTAQTNRDSALATLNWYKGKPSESDIAEANANLALAKAQLEDAQRAYDRVKDGPTSADLAVAQAKVNAAQSTLNSSKIIAPFDGTITSLSTLVGDQVSSGTSALRIDNLKTLVLDLNVSEVDISKIEVGQTATITFDAIADVTYQGQVEEVNRAGTTTNGTVNFSVSVIVTDPDDQVMPGMTAEAAIQVQKVENVLAVPSTAVVTRNGKSMVYLAGGTTLEVTTGVVTDTMTEITSGNLAEGDAVVTDPTSSTSTTENTNSGNIFQQLMRSLGGGSMGRNGNMGGSRPSGTDGNFTPPTGSDGSMPQPPSGGAMP